MVLFKKRITKAPIRLCGWAGWSAPVLFTNSRRQVFSRRGPNKTHFFPFLEVKLKQQLEKISHMVKRFHKELRDMKPTPECKSKSTFSKNLFRNTFRVSNSFNPDQVGQNAGPDLGPICLQRSSAKTKFATGSQSP